MTKLTKPTYSMLGIIKKNFKYLNNDAFLTLYKTLVRSHLEYANSVWNPHSEKLIKDLERVQMRATKIIGHIKSMSYIHCEAKKTAPFYFCNSFVRTPSFMTMFGKIGRAHV